MSFQHVSAALLSLAVTSAAAQGTAFNYQGVITDGGTTIDGVVDLEFRLYDDATAGSQLGSSIVLVDEAVNNGLVNVELDWGSTYFDGRSLWLEIAVDQDGGADSFSTLTPRVQILPVPYANYASTSGADLSEVLQQGSDAGGSSITNVDSISASSFSGDGSALTGIDVNDADADPTNEIQDLSQLPEGVGLGTTPGVRGVYFPGNFGLYSGPGGTTSSGNLTGTNVYTGTVLEQHFLPPAQTTVQEIAVRFASTPLSPVTFEVYSVDSISGTITGLVFSKDLGLVTSTLPTRIGVSIDVGGDPLSASLPTFLWRVVPDSGTISMYGRSSSLLDFEVVTGTARPILVSGSNAEVGILTSPVSNQPLTVGASTSNGNGAHVTPGGTWTNGSSREWKSNFQKLDSLEILNRLANLPITRWEYTGSDEGAHVGPTAEDFHAAFGLGGNPQYISTVDADGVAFSAIQGLNEKLEQESAKLSKENAELRERLERLEALLLEPEN